MKRPTYNDLIAPWRAQWQQLYGSPETETGALSDAERYALEQFAPDDEDAVRDHRDVRGS